MRRLSKGANGNIQLEYVLTCDGDPQRQMRQLLQAANRNPAVDTEITIILEYLFGRRAVDCFTRRGSTSSFADSSPPAIRLNPSDWIEPIFTATFSVRERRIQSHEAVQRRDYIYSGTSPNGDYVFFLHKTKIELHRLNGLTLSVAPLRSPIMQAPSRYDRAALTDEYIAILALNVVKVSRILQLDEPTLATARRCRKDGWVYRAVAIHKTDTHTFMAVASQHSSQGNIDVFKVLSEARDAAPTLWNLDGHFGNSKAMSQAIDLKFSQDGNRLACVTLDSTVLVWQMIRGRPAGPPHLISRKFALVTNAAFFKRDHKLTDFRNKIGQASRLLFLSTHQFRSDHFSSRPLPLLYEEPRTRGILESGPTSTHRPQGRAMCP